MDKDPKTFFTWVVQRRGFFQHQSETDPTRWLHSTQRQFEVDAFVMAEVSAAVYWERNAGKVFAPDLDHRYVEAAEAARALMKISVDIFGNHPNGAPVRRTVVVEGPGTKPTAFMATQTLMAAMKLADEHLISVRQITATVDKTHELLFSYTCAVNEQTS